MSFGGLIADLRMALADKEEAIEKLLASETSLRAALAKTEAERDEARAVAEGRRAAVLAFEHVLNAERTRAEKYLAAIQEAEHIAMKGVRDINDGTWISDIALLLRPLVEEAKRG